MAYYYGYQGSVKFNSTGGAAATLVQITDWSMSVEKQVYETTQINDTYSKKCGGLISGSGSVNLIYTGDNNTFIEAVNTSSDAGTALFELYISQADTKRPSQASRQPTAPRRPASQRYGRCSLVMATPSGYQSD
jgi:hypothetical protein